MAGLLGRQQRGGCYAVVEDIRRNGITLVRAIADQLNADEILTPRGGRWHPTSVARLLERIAA
jgi:hypothetical protein